MSDTLTKYLLNTIHIISFIVFISYIFIDMRLWLLGITFGWIFYWFVGSIILHRYIIHKVFTVNKYIKIVFILLATLGCTGSSIGWAAIHRMHHKYSDTLLDPHSPTHLSWFQILTLSYSHNTNITNMLVVKDLLTDNIYVFFHKYYTYVLILSLMIIASISYEILIVYLIGVYYHLLGMFFNAYISHSKIKYINYKNHELNNHSYNSHLFNILFHGESYHNNHHNNSSRLSDGEKWYEWDLNRLIQLLRLK